ncbi:MAG: hypothetical protein HUK20_14070 [Fibrobacter sp.]|nr:hypothetical protein [Fibrobacter sp.]
MKRMIFLSFLVFPLAVFANEMCENLCSTCEGAEQNESCHRVMETCHCQELKEAKQAKEIQFAEDIKRLSEALLNTCEGSVCAKKISLTNRRFIAMENSALSSEQAMMGELEQDDGVNGTSRVEPLPTMTAECSSVCSSCKLDADTVAAHVEGGNLQFNYPDELCYKIDGMCKCSDYAVNEYMLGIQRAQDSVKNFNRRLKAVEQSKVLAEEILNKCTTKDTCAFIITLYTPSMKMVDIREAAKPQGPQNPVIKPVADSTPVAKPQEELKTENRQDEKKWYKVVGVYYGQVEGDPFWGWKSGFRDYPDGDMFGFSWHFRRYFYSAGSFQFGANLSIHLVDAAQDSYKFIESDVSYSYTNLSLEFPIAVRFGDPIHKFFAPYISGILTIRKPLFLSIDYDVSSRYYEYRFDSYSDAITTSSGGYHHIYDGDSRMGFYDAEDWEIGIHLGFGFEVNRHISVEYQMLLKSTAIGFGVHNFYESRDEAWQFNIQFAW